MIDIGMDISASNREIYALDSNKIPEKSEKSEFFVTGPESYLTYLLHKSHENKQFGKVS